MTIRHEHAIEKIILSELSRLHGKVDQSLAQGRENSEDIKILCKELGITGTHGRLPLVEQTQANHECRLQAVEAEQIRTSTRRGVATTAASLLGGGLGGSLINLIVRMVHF